MKELTEWIFPNFKRLRFIAQPIILIFISNYEVQIKNDQGTQNMWNTKREQRKGLILLWSQI